MYSLDNQIDPYTAEDFNAEAEAQHFFKSYGEADIAKKLNEMTTIQQSIEVVLRQKVRANYGMFLLANDEIQQVDEEMLDLKHLVTNTQKLMDVSKLSPPSDEVPMQILTFQLSTHFVGCTR